MMIRAVLGAVSDEALSRRFKISNWEIEIVFICSPSASSVFSAVDNQIIFGVELRANSGIG